MIAMSPAFAARCMESAKGKNASDAKMLPFDRSEAFSIAISTLSTRLICPAPTPTKAASRAKMIALLLTCRTISQPNAMSSHNSSATATLVTVFQVKLIGG